MKVQMNVTTHYDGQKLEKGQAVDVEPAIAERWEKAGIAQPVPVKKAKEPK